MEQSERWIDRFPGLRWLDPERRKKAEEILSEAEAARQELIRSCREQVGPALWDCFVSDLERARRGLDEDDPAVRETALVVLFRLNKPTPEDHSRCKHLAQHDPDLRAREVAIVYLAGAYEDSHDPEVLSLLARLVADPQEPVAIRMVAYRGLIAVTGQRLTWTPPTFQLRSLDDIDWTFVRRFLPPEGGSVS